MTLYQMALFEATYHHTSFTLCFLIPLYMCNYTHKCLTQNERKKSHGSGISLTVPPILLRSNVEIYLYQSTAQFSQDMMRVEWQSAKKLLVFSLQYISSNITALLQFFCTICILFYANELYYRMHGFTNSCDICLVELTPPEKIAFTTRKNC